MYYTLRGDVFLDKSEEATLQEYNIFPYCSKKELDGKQSPARKKPSSILI